MSATALLERNPRPSEEEVKVALQGNICRCTGYVNIVEAVVAAGGREVTTVETERARHPPEGLRRAVDPAQGGQAARPGRGSFFDDVRRHGMGYVHFVRSPYAHARIVSIDVSPALALEGVYGTITGDEVAIQTDPFFEMSTPPGNAIKDYALAVGKVRHMGEPVAAVVRRHPRARARRRRADRGRVRGAPRPRRRRGGAEGRDRSCTTTPARTSSGPASSTGATSTRRSRRPTTS